MATKKKSAKSEAVEATNATAPSSTVERKPVLPPAGKGRVFLIDSMSFIFRAYHAMARQRPMSTRTGIPTSATYVFVNMLNKLRKDFAPEYIAAVFDLPEPTFRDEEAKSMPPLRRRDKAGEVVETVYDGYKANRSEMPADLSQQVPYIRRALEAYRIPILAVAGWEADDVIGTLARKAAGDGYGVYVVSSDKDMLQLVGDKVCVLNPPKDNLICDGAKVEELLGVRPEQVIDLMALRGDSIDNIPGAPGIGEKGSTELIQKFGSLDALLERAQEVERKTYRESLADNREMILLSRQLATINQQVEIDFEAAAMKAQSPDVIAARELFTELEFTSLVKEFLAEGVEVGKTDYRRAESAEEISALLTSRGEAAVAVAIDAAMSAAPPPENGESAEENGEQMSLESSLAAAESVPKKPHDIGLSVAPAKALVAALDAGAVGEKLAALLGDATVSKAVHDSKAALKALRAAGIEARAKELHDTMLYSYLLDPTYSSQTLSDVALRRMGLRLTGDLGEAADVTGRMAATLHEEVEAAGLADVYRDIDLPLVPVLARMEEAGVKVDGDALEAMSKHLQSECERVAARIYELAGFEFNINSPRQLGDVLFNKMGLPTPVKYGKGKTISTAQDVLEGLATEHEVPKLVLEYRQLSKLKSTYVDTLPLLCRASGRVHTTFNHAATATGRLSSTNPNLQNIPIRTELGREIRAAFVAEPGCMLLAADYSQIELRLLAHYSEDELLVEAYRRGDDIHTLTAAQVFGVPPMLIDAEHRRRAKAVNFGIVYGLSPFGLAQQIGIEQREAKKFIDAYFERYAGVRKFIDATLERARIEGKVRTLFGRVRPIPDINSRNPNMRGFAERTAVNTPLQGTAADLIKLAMIRIDHDLCERGLKTKMLLQVHDELVFEVPEDEVDTVHALVKERMENVRPLRVPLVVEIGVGRNWRDV